MARDYVLETFQRPVELQIDYQKELNVQQCQAVMAPPGPALVIAGAGAGKTRTLIYRVAYLLEQGISADRILLLTFTNKAAHEMMRRVGDLLGNDLTGLWGGTFHAIGNRILRRHARLLGYQPDFTIMDREDARDLMDACLADSSIDVKERRFPKADVLCDIISLAVNRQSLVQEILDQQYDYFSELGGEIAGLKTAYQARKRSVNAVDFDDLLVLWLELLRQHEEVREQYQRRFQFILVDEYQDTNKLQADLVDLLAARHHNVMVVGDDSQSIYSWRGANFKNILEFPRRYPEAVLFKIETNYRSTPEILAMANAAIAPNVHQYRKELKASRKPGIKPVIVACGDAAEQAAFIGQRVLELREEGTSLREMAVLYRSHFHALELQLELTRRNIPFVITSGMRFFEQAHVKDVAAYLKWVSNPQDEISFKRLVRMLPGIGGKTAMKLWRRVQTEMSAGAPPPDGANGKRGLGAVLQASIPAVPRKAVADWAQFSATIYQLEEKIATAPVGDLLKLVIEAGYADYLKERYSNYRLRLEDLEQLIVFSGRYATVDAFLTQLALVSHLEAEEGQARNTDDEQLKLSSIHQAKGLEFDVVFIIMLCEGLFPSARSMKSSEDEEEERRLFYVAITRARNELYLAYPMIRGGYVSTGGMQQQPSRFLREIPKTLREEWNLRPAVFFRE